MNKGQLRQETGPKEEAPKGKAAQRSALAAEIALLVIRKRNRSGEGTFKNVPKSPMRSEGE